MTESPEFAPPTADAAATAAPMPTWKAAAALVVGYCLLALGWRAFVEIGSAILLFGWLFATGHDLAALAEADPLSLVPTELLALGSIVQGVGMAGIGVGLALAVRWRLRDAFALGGARWWAWLAGAAGGLTVGLFPGWIAYHLERLAPWLSLGNLDAIATALQSGGPAGQVLMVIAIVIAAPLAEELAFRGFLWSAMERVAPAWAVWVITSAMFAIYHVDPLHVIAVLFTGLFLGWLRWSTGSVWPGVVAHLVNNLLGTIAVFALTDANDVVTPWWAAIGCALVTMALGALAAVGGRRSDAVSVAPGA